MSTMLLRKIARPVMGLSRISARPSLLSVLSCRTASNMPASPQPLRMPPDMPREDYAAPAAYTMSFLGRTIKYVFLGAAGLAGVAFLTFEGLHMYIEHVSLAPASRAADNDTFAWADENQAWTGGAAGGTDSRLGWRARHALRGAWICWEWGAGEAAGTIAKNPGSIHPDLGRRGMIGASGPINRVDRGYELADEYIDAAIAHARAKGLAFPPVLDAVRPAGPPTSPKKDNTSPTDPAALDLVMLKAGICERMGTPDTLAHARELYEQLLNARLNDDPTASPVREARVLRLAHKLGDLAARAGDVAEAQSWWAWGLRRENIHFPDTSTAPASPPSNRSWWSVWRSSPPQVSQEVVNVPAVTSQLAPPVLRAVISLLISASAADAQSGALEAAASTQSLALSLLPPGNGLATVPTASTGAASLQRTWIEQRAALLALHRASVSHARGDSGGAPLELACTASDSAERVLGFLTPSLPSAFTTPSSNVLTQPAKRVLRDTLLTAAEAFYTRAALLERGAKGAHTDDVIHRLEHACECYERAMSFSAAEAGTTDTKAGDGDGVGRGEEWMRYWRGYVRVRDKIMREMEGARTKPADPVHP